MLCLARCHYGRRNSYHLPPARAHARSGPKAGRDRFGVRVLKGGQIKADRAEIWESCGKGEVKYILANPETLIQEKVLPKLSELSISHMVIDKAHTVSEWGDSFRPSYLKLAEIRKEAKIG